MLKILILVGAVLLALFFFFPEQMEDAVDEVQDTVETVTDNVSLPGGGGGVAGGVAGGGDVGGGGGEVKGDGGIVHSGHTNPRLCQPQADAPVAAVGVQYLARFLQHPFFDAVVKLDRLERVDLEK